MKKLVDVISKLRYFEQRDCPEIELNWWPLYQRQQPPVMSEHIQTLSAGEAGTIISYFCRVGRLMHLVN